MPTWSYVNGTGGHVSSHQANLSVTTTWSVTPNNLLVICIAEYQIQSTPILSDGTANEYFLIANSFSISVIEEAYAMFMCNPVVGGILTLTYTPDEGDGGSGYPSMSIDEYSLPIGYAAIVDNINNNQESNSTTPQSDGNVIVSGIDLVVMVTCTFNPMGTITAGSGFTLTYTSASLGAGTFMSIATEYQLDVVSDLQSTLSIGSSQPWSTLTVAFKAVPRPPTGIWAYVNGMGDHVPGGAQSSLDVTTTWSVTPGNLLVIGIADYNAGTAVTLIDGTANVYNLVFVVNSSSGGSLWWCIPTVGGTLTLTYTPEVNAFPSISVDEYSLASGYSISVDSTDQNSGTNAPVQSSSDLTITSRDLVVMVVPTLCEQASTAETNFTLTYSIGWAPSSQLGLGTEYLLNIIDNIQSSMNLGGGGDWNAFSIAFKATSSGQFNETLSDTLSGTLNDSLSSDVKFNRILNQSISFNQNVISDANFHRIFSQNISFTDLIIDGTFITEVLTQNLTLSQTLNRHIICKRLLSNTLVINDLTRNEPPLLSLPLHVVTISDKLGLSQNTILNFNNVYQILSMPYSSLITTSGRLRVDNLNSIVDIIINNYSNRKVDWVVVFEGDVMAIIHTNNIVIYL